MLVGSSASAVVLSGGGASATKVNSGGTLIVSAGGSLTGGLTLSGGRAVISGTVAAGQSVTYAGTGGDLALTASASFAATISGFTGTTDKIDLTFLSYKSGTTSAKFTEAASNTSGTLTVTSGGVSESLTLLGSYVTANFVLSSDGAAGTFIVDPPVKPHTVKVIAASPDHKKLPAADARALFAHLGAPGLHAPEPARAGGTISAATPRELALALVPRHADWLFGER
jgi:autotransporter passenger strand-loop-strand repeat protein